jgi:hypothetical protein
MLKNAGNRLLTRAAQNASLVFSSQLLSRDREGAFSASC